LQASQNFTPNQCKHKQTKTKNIKQKRDGPMSIFKIGIIFGMSNKNHNNSANLYLYRPLPSTTCNALDVPVVSRTKIKVFNCYTEKKIDKAVT